MVHLNSNLSSGSVVCHQILLSFFGGVCECEITLLSPEKRESEFYF